jgi:hypothetical protein
MAAMSLRMPDELSERLRLAATEEGESINGAVVVAVRDWLDRRDADHVEQLFEETAARHGRLLERLADA